MGAVSGTLSDPQPILDHPSWQDGDFTLVSSDGVRFRVPSCLLFASSTVFRDAQGVCSGSAPELALHDAQLERAAVVHGFLQLVRGADVFAALGRDTPWTAAAVWFDVARFAVKYDSALGRRLLFLAVSRALHERRIGNLRAFVLGAHLDSAALCADALRDRHAAGAWRHPFALAGRDALEPGAMPLAVWESIPARYCWALSRAWAQRPKSGPGRDDWLDISGFFLEAMQEASASASILAA